MLRKKDYIFTNKKHSKKAIMSTVLSVIAVVSIIIAIYLSYVNKGMKNPRYGAACVLSMIFAFVGIGLGVAGRMEKDRFYLFCYLGIFFGLAAIGLISIILYAGALLL